MLLLSLDLSWFCCPVAPGAPGADAWWLQIEPAPLHPEKWQYAGIKRVQKETWDMGWGSSLRGESIQSQWLLPSSKDSTPESPAVADSFSCLFLMISCNSDPELLYRNTLEFEFYSKCTCSGFLKGHRHTARESTKTTQVLNNSHFQPYLYPLYIAQLISTDQRKSIIYRQHYWSGKNLLF